MNSLVTHDPIYLANIAKKTHYNASNFGLLTKDTQSDSQIFKECSLNHLNVIDTFISTDKMDTICLFKILKFYLKFCNSKNRETESRRANQNNYTKKHYCNAWTKKIYKYKTIL